VAATAATERRPQVDLLVVVKVMAVEMVDQAVVVVV
jgi:hypothetical protein